MRGFTTVDLTPQCETRLKGRYEYGVLERVEGAAELIGECAGNIWRQPDAFEVPLTGTEGRLTLSWSASSPTCGIVVLRDRRQTLLVALLASGLDPAADTTTLDAFHQYVVRQLRDTPFEPAFDLINLWQRPLLASIGLFIPEREPDRRLFALIDRCFAAAFFRRLGLA